MLHPLRRALVAAFVIAAAGFANEPSQAHEAKAGDIAIVHPYATPTPPGATVGAAYFMALDNGGVQADKLVRASTPVAAGVEMHTMSVDGQGVMRMREVDGIVLAPKGSIKMRPGMGLHLMLVGLKGPLKEGAAFAMTLEFERAGKVQVQVVVETPKADAAPAPMHMH